MRRSTRSSMVLMVSFAVFAMVASAPPAFADWSDNFDGGLQESWSFNNLDGLGSPSGTFTAGSVVNQLQLTDSNSASTGGAGVGFGTVAEFFQDVKMTGVVNPNADVGINRTLMLIARANVASGQFYAAEVNYGTGELIIFRNDSLAGGGTNLVAALIPELNGGAATPSIYVEFDVVGNSLAARAFDTPGGNLLQSVSTSDATYTGANLSGVLVSAIDTGSPILGAWDDVTATAVVPEPSTAVLGFASLVGAITRRRRRRAG